MITASYFSAIEHCYADHFDQAISENYVAILRKQLFYGRFPTIPHINDMLFENDEWKRNVFAVLFHSAQLRAKKNEYPVSSMLLALQEECQTLNMEPDLVREDAERFLFMRNLVYIDSKNHICSHPILEVQIC